MGLACFVLAGQAVASRSAWLTALPGLAAFGGAWLLMGWDLVLDPAMAHESLPLKFWIWSESGPYFGMPLKNLGAWFLTGLVYMGLSQALWGGVASLRSVPIGLPLAVYLANLLFASVISLSVGLWQPVLLALLWSALPLPLLLAAARASRAGQSQTAAA
jgi:putative membrane protein